MALIKHANAKDLTRDAVVLDLGDLHRQGELLIESAKRRAADIIKQAEAERDRLIAGAAEKGHAEGLARGLDEGRKRGEDRGRAEAAESIKAELEALRAGWESALAAFTADRDRMLLEARDDVLRLALRIAEKVTKRRIDTDPAVAAAQLESILALITRPTELVIAIHPADRAAIEHALPALLTTLTATPRHIELTDDAALPRGSCIARTRGSSDDSGGGGSGGGGGGGEINASIDLQLHRIAEALLPTHEGVTDGGAPQ